MKTLLFILICAVSANAQKKPINTKIFWFAGSAIIVGSVLTMPDKEIKSTPLLGVGVVAIGFTLDMRNLRTKKRAKMLRNTAKHQMFKQPNYIQPPWQ